MHGGGRGSKVWSMGPTRHPRNPILVRPNPGVSDTERGYGGGEVPYETFPPIQPLPLRTNPPEKVYSLISCWRLTIHIFHLSGGNPDPCNKWDIHAPSPPPIERGPRNQEGGIQLNRLSVSYHRPSSVGLTTHSRKDLPVPWLLVRAGRSQRQKVGE